MVMDFVEFVNHKYISMDNSWESRVVIKKELMMTMSLKPKTLKTFIIK